MINLPQIQKKTDEKRARKLVTLSSQVTIALMGFVILLVLSYCLMCNDSGSSIHYKILFVTAFYISSPFLIAGCCVLLIVELLFRYQALKPEKDRNFNISIYLSWVFPIFILSLGPLYYFYIKYTDYQFIENEKPKDSPPIGFMMPTNKTLPVGYFEAYHRYHRASYEIHYLNSAHQEIIVEERMGRCENTQWYGSGQHRRYAFTYQEHTGTAVNTGTEISPNYDIYLNDHNKCLKLTNAPISGSATVQQSIERLFNSFNSSK